ncbi:hypothetical protein C7Y66_15700 [Chroococcidiopsis sp. CCALA 051]|uniref:hypothetical protein n=1 Tax=Chroococcidiopsis sp. CCALA 051 TaxID=869949 RepID=UPI000D0E14F6|nr:hypothetical protein [Chroococcidiopsis sp. CCALA 051]PSM48180.1 hypothetical protein C7Y66_15700 [Chroococcidiopsis sp. CCALA 051]
MHKFENNLLEVRNLFLQKSEWTPKFYHHQTNKFLFTRTDGLELYLSVENQRLIAQIHDLNTRIGISLSKSPTVIFTEIGRRLIVPAEIEWQQLLEKRAAKEQVEKKRQEALRKLLVACKADYYLNKDLKNCYTFSQITQKGSIQCQVDSAESVSMKLQFIHSNTALQIVQLMAEERSAQ